MFPVDKAHSWRQVASSRLKLTGVSANLDSFAGHLGKVGDLGEAGQGAGESSERLVQDIQDVVDYGQETEKFTEPEERLCFGPRQADISLIIDTN